MKKFIPALIITGMMSAVFVACGPSAEEKAAAEQHMKDSIAFVEQARADSTMKAMEDSLAMVKFMEDSLANVKAMEDSIAAVASSRPRKPKAQPKPDVPKVGSKKPGAN